MYSMAPIVRHAPKASTTYITNPLVTSPVAVTGSYVENIWDVELGDDEEVAGALNLVSRLKVQDQEKEEEDEDEDEDEEEPCIEDFPVTLCYERGASKWKLIRCYENVGPWHQDENAEIEGRLESIQQEVNRILEACTITRFSP